MPAIISHHLFGRALLARQGNKVFSTRSARDAFLLGNQGPDPLFYAVRTPYVINTTTLARCMHTQRLDEYLHMWRVMQSNVLIKDQYYETMRAYLFGYLCHYTLDRAVHPLVYAQEEAICTAGVEGLEPQDHTFVHSQIEADLDIYLLNKLTGLTLSEYCIPKQVLVASNETLADIDPLYNSVAQFFGVPIAPHMYTRSVKDMRLAQKILYSPGGTRRRLVGKVERLVRRHSLLQAASHRPEAHEDTWFANDAHNEWVNPGTQEVSNLSYLELFKGALDEAESNIKLFDENAKMSSITHGLDFHGNPMAMRV